ncbi:MAG: CoB--CoM heterodisulfide reductase iron-sulfur subunit A family protein [Candidatus Thermoplasmatota archaeon]|nr:CoB--CoM heterodisulfide reductase iron-sulfur subunit A family protein [Candidatus Thermoplasmatota archaeon]
MQQSVLVIGGGIAGVQSALDLADQGIKVYLVDKRPSIGGNMAKLDKTFPTNDCSMCILAPKLVALGRHGNITLLTNSEVVSVEGKKGNFKVKVKLMPRYIKDDCVACGECSLVCPVVLPNEFDAGLGSRKAIYTPFPQSVPSTYIIDLENCLNKGGIIKCKHCVDACESNSIDFDAKEEIIELQVGAVILATGFELLDPRIRKEYGYGKFENVVSSLEYERLLSASGPTGGKILRPSDLKKPNKIAFIQCVGSRSEQLGYPYCSRVCCMYATKEASISKDADPATEIYIFYMDLRAYGKDFQQYYNKAQEMGIKYIRGRPSSVYELRNKNICIRYKDTYTDRVEELEVELLVLCSAIAPSTENKKLADILGIELDENMFFKQKDLLLDPIASTKEGIYLAGCAQAPKDIPDTVAQASAAAAKASSGIKKRALKKSSPPETAIPYEPPRVGVWVCKCGKNIAGYLDVEEVAKYAEQLPYVAHIAVELFACSEDALRRLKESIEEHKLNRVVIAACSPITHAPLFQDTIQEVGLNKYLLEFANIRNQCSWVHSQERNSATEKAKALVRMAVSKVSLLEPLKEYELPVPKKALVVGGGIAGINSAIALAQFGIEVALVEKAEKLGGKLNSLYKLFPSDLEASKVLEKLLKQLKKTKNIEIFKNAKISAVTGYVGNFDVKLTCNGSARREEKISQVGTIVLATGCEEIVLGNSNYYGKHPNIITQLELETKLKEGKLGNNFTNVVIINCVGMDEQRPYCCRIGCGNSIKNARLIKERIPTANIFILYKDMRIFGKQEEEYFADVLKNVRPFLIRYDREPEVEIENNLIKVRVKDLLLNEDLEIATDLLVLTPLLEGSRDVEELKKILKLPTGAGDFWQEAHAKLRPLDFNSDGIYLCGSAQYPKNLADCTAQAYGSAARAGIPMLKGFVRAEGIVSTVDKNRCSGCGICIAICPYDAIQLVEGIAKVNEVVCKGCGACVATCPNVAIDQYGFRDRQIISTVDSCWAE